MVKQVRVIQLPLKILIDVEVYIWKQYDYNNILIYVHVLVIKSIFYNNTVEYPAYMHTRAQQLRVFIYYVKRYETDPTSISRNYMYNSSKQKIKVLCKAKIVSGQITPAG